MAALMFVLSAVSVPLLTPSTAYAQSSSTAAMTNADVVKLAKPGFGSEVIKEKINGASTVNFKLDVDDLVKLKNAGVSQDVIPPCSSVPTLVAPLWLRVPRWAPHPARPVIRVALMPRW